MKTATTVAVLILLFAPLDVLPQCSQPVFARNNPMLCNTGLS
jgi:hypothetical protein